MSFSAYFYVNYQYIVTNTNSSRATAWNIRKIKPIDRCPCMAKHVSVGQYPLFVKDSVTASKTGTEKNTETQKIILPRKGCIIRRIFLQRNLMGKSHTQVPIANIFATNGHTKISRIPGKPTRIGIHL